MKRSLLLLTLVVGWSAHAQAPGIRRVQDEATNRPARSTINFTGTGVSCADNSGSARTDCTINGTSTGYATIQDEGGALTQQPTVNFIGAGISCVNNGGATKTDCTIAGGGTDLSAEDIVTGSASANMSAERVATDTASVDVDTGTGGQMKWNVLPAGVTLAGDVDGAGNANDLDELAVESELEAVLDLDQLQGAVTDGQVPNTITIDLSATATALASDPANCADATHFATGITAAGVADCEAIAAGDVPTLNQNTTGTAAGLSATLAIGSGGTGQTGAVAAFDALAPTTTIGDIIKHNGTDNVRVARGAAGKVLKVNAGGTDIEWGDDATGAASAWTNYEIDFGSEAKLAATATVTDAASGTSSIIIIQQVGIAATGRQADEAEMDGLQCRAIPAAGTFKLICASLEGATHGLHTVSYQVN